MANVFGVPVTDETLKEMEKYQGKTITRFDRAHEALNMQTDGGKQQQASDYVKELKKEYGDGVSTLCVFYNATGDPIALVDDHTWHGKLWRGSYPQVVANGQWGAFLHVKPSWPNVGHHGSSAALVYRGKNDSAYEYDFLFSWHNGWRMHASREEGAAADDNSLADGGSTVDGVAAVESLGSSHNTAYTEILELGRSVNWDDIEGKTKRARSNWTTEEHGCKGMTSIGDNTTSDFTAILTLQGA